MHAHTRLPPISFHMWYGTHIDAYIGSYVYINLMPDNTLNYRQNMPSQVSSASDSLNQ